MKFVAIRIIVLMLMISINHLSIDLRAGLAVAPSDSNLTPSVEALIPGPAGSCRMGSPLADVPRAFEAGVPFRAPAEAGEARARAALPIAVGAGPGMLPPEDGVGKWIKAVDRRVTDVFPANRIFTQCGGCGEGISRFKGYKHYWVGDRKTYCAKCHRAMGLPLRDE